MNNIIPGNLNKAFTTEIMDWFRENKRDLPWRADKDPYHVWVSEIMLQQTRVEAVKEYYNRWMDALPSIKDLAEAEEDRILKLWQGLGYYNRVRNMQKAARAICTSCGGVFPEAYADILALPGIGEYTAGAIASNCFDQPVPAVDGNVLRVMTRLTEDFDDISKQTTKKRIAAYLKELYPERDCGDFTQGLMELGATVCVPNGLPKCDICPVADRCLALQNDTIMQLPVKVKKGERKIVEMTVFLLTTGDGYQAVRKRPKTGLLSGLYEFPNVTGKMSPDQALQQTSDWGCEPFSLTRSSEYKHIFSHVEWHMTGYYISCSRRGGEVEDFLWASEEQLEQEIAIPSAFQYFLT